MKTVLILYISCSCNVMMTYFRASVDCVSVHPSGKLALTVGRDRALHTWNLITGRSAYITNLKQGNLYCLRASADKVSQPPITFLLALDYVYLLPIFYIIFKYVCNIVWRLHINLTLANLDLPTFILLLSFIIGFRNS